MSASVYSPLSQSEPDDRYRRRTGLLLGAALGLVYGLITQAGNRLAVPSVPLYQAPLGTVGNIVLYTLAGALLGLLVAIPRSGLKGVFLMAGAGAGAIILLSLLTSASLSENFALGVVAVLSLALPFWGLFVPIFAAVRWVINHQEESRRDRQPWRGRVFGPLALVAVVAWAASFSLYPPEGRQTLQAAHALLGASQSGLLPEPLSAVSGFAPHAASPYQLAWEVGDLNKYRIPRPNRAFDRHSAVIARYPDGWNLVCVYITLNEPPICRGFASLPR